MKKSSYQIKRFLRARQRFQLKRAQWRNGTKRRGSSQQLRTRAADFEDATAPAKFTLEPSNVENSLSFIAQIKLIARGKKDVNLILTQVEEIGIGAISMLISVMEELKRKQIYLKGSKPENIQARNVLERSGFMKYVKGKVSAENSVTKNVIFTTGNTSTHQRNIIDSIRASNQTIWGERGRSPLLYGTLVEMIKNSCKHAFKSKDKVTWHISVNHDDENSRVKFSFVDNGIGVINSFEQAEILKSFHGLFRDNADFIETAFKNGIESKTGKSWRGTGLPTIYETFEDSIIKRLVVITNNVYCDFQSEQSVILQNTFSGTYYYWEMDRTCNKHSFL